MARMINARGEPVDVTGQRKDETAVCANCLQPFEPGQHYCAHCGEAVGQLTPLVPFVNIRWQASIWGRIWKQTWDPKTSWLSRIPRLLLILLCAPIMLAGLIPLLWRKNDQGESPQEPNGRA